MEPYYALKLHDIRSNIERRILYQTSEASKVKLRLQNDCFGENFEIQNIIPESLHYIRYEMKKSYKIENIIEKEIKNICSKCESLQQDIKSQWDVDINISYEYTIERFIVSISNGLENYNYSLDLIEENFEEDCLAESEENFEEDCLAESEESFEEFLEHECSCDSSFFDDSCDEIFFDEQAPVRKTKEKVWRAPKESEVFEVVANHNGFCEFFPIETRNSISTRWIEIYYCPNTKKLQEGVLHKIFCQIKWKKRIFNYKKYFMKTLEDKQMMLNKEKSLELYDTLRKKCNLYFFYTEEVVFIGDNIFGELIEEMLDYNSMNKIEVERRTTEDFFLWWISGELRRKLDRAITLGIYKEMRPEYIDW